MHEGLQTGRGDVTKTPLQPVTTASWDNGTCLQSWWWLMGGSLIGAGTGIWMMNNNYCDMIFYFYIGH